MRALSIIAAFILASGAFAQDGLDASGIPSGGGGLSSAAADAAYVNVSGDTMTGSLLFSGVTSDITSTSTEDVTIYAPGSGADVIFRTGDSTTEFVDGSDGTTLRMQFQWSESAAVGWLTAGTGALGFYASGAPFFGATTNVASSVAAGCFGETLSGVNAGSSTFCSYGGGHYATLQTDTQTCADNSTPASAGTLTVSPASAYVSITVADPDGCTLTVGETSAVSRAVVDVVHAGFSGSGAGIITAAAVAGVYDNGGVACVLNDGGVMGLTYSLANVWSQRYCAAN